MLSMPFGEMAERAGWHSPGPGPGVLSEIGILYAKLEATLRTLVEPVPEAECTLLNVTNIAGTDSIADEGLKSFTAPLP